MSFLRASGVLLHPTSLPGPHGIGDFGPAAYRFVDFLYSAGQKLWQVLPLNPTGGASTQILPTTVRPLDENTKAVIEALDAARKNREASDSIN
jgi:4-alpha-glucanotransferase